MKRLSIVFLIGAILALLCTAPAQSALLGIDWDTGNLYNVSTTDASLSLIGSTGLLQPASLEFAPNGTLYSFTVAPAVLYTINPTTAVANVVGPLNISGFEGGLAFAPDGTAYGVNGDNASNPQLFTLNLNTGAATVVGTISGGDHDINGLAWRSDGNLIGIDDLTNSLLIINPVTAVSSLLESLTPTVGAVGGMTAIGDNGFFSTAGPGAISPGSNELYSFNLFTGSYSLIGSFPSATGTGISGLAESVPEPSTFLLLGAGLAGVGLLRRRFKS